MSFLKKFLLFAVVVALAVFGTNYALRPEALCRPVIRDKAVMTVPGSLIVVAEYEQPLLSEVGGRLIKSELVTGKEVKTGQVLAQIDPTDLQYEIERIEIDADAAKARIAVGSQIELELQSAKEALQEFENRFKLRNYPEAELIKQRRLVEGIELRLSLEKVANQQLIDGFENTLKVKKRQLSKMTITAQFDGVVTDILAQPGAVIGDRTPIANLIATNRTIEAKISEENFAGIKKGQFATVRFLGYGDYLYKGSVSEILPTADPTTQRYRVHLTVDIPPEKLTPGLTGEVSILTGEHDNALVIPRRALFGSNVYVVNDDRVELREIKTGFSTFNAVEVLSGLNEGDLVVVDRLETFSDGDRVKVELEDPSKF